MCDHDHEMANFKKAVYSAAAMLQCINIHMTRPKKVCSL
jgi:hypothetical protein